MGREEAQKKLERRKGGPASLGVERRASSWGEPKKGRDKQTHICTWDRPLNTFCGNAPYCHSCSLDNDNVVATAVASFRVTVFSLFKSIVNKCGITIS